MPIKKTEESKMELAKYIVLTEDKKEVRFFAIGLVDDDESFTGIIHDYVGGGNNKERLVFKDKWIPNEILNEPLEWDDEVELFNSMSPYTVDQIETEMDKLICYDTDVYNYVPQNGTMKYYNEGVLIDNMSRPVPFGLGITTFLDGYEITEVLSLQEIELHKKIKSFVDNLSNADVIRVNDSPLLESWEIFIEMGDFDLISTSWREENGLWEFGLNEDNIKNIKREGNSYKISTFDSEYEDTITLYELKVIGGAK